MVHWEKDVRFASASALAYIAEKCPEAISTEQLILLGNVQITDDINKIHGHCQGLASMLKFLNKVPGLIL